MLSDRRVVVVGATGGIGGAVVGELRRQGASVLATGRDPTRSAALERSGLPVERLDVAHPDAGPRLAARVRTEFGTRLDGLVVAAGALGPIGPTRSVDLRAIERTIREGPVAALALVQALAEALDAATSPSVVLFSGGGATGAFPRFTAYALAKVALVRLVENLAEEEPAWKVNAVAPGFVATAIHDATLAADPDVAGPYREETRQRLVDATPPAAAAELVAFLLSDASTGVTGRVISAAWDEWRDPDGRRLLVEDPSFGRLRRIDGRRFLDTATQPRASTLPEA